MVGGETASVFWKPNNLLLSYPPKPELVVVKVIIMTIGPWK